MIESKNRVEVAVPASSRLVKKCLNKNVTDYSLPECLDLMRDLQQMDTTELQACKKLISQLERRIKELVLAAENRVKPRQ